MSDQPSTRAFPGGGVVDAVRPYVLRLPGLRPYAPKRNVIVGLVYLYLLGTVAWLLL